MCWCCDYEDDDTIECECQNCGEIWLEDELINPIPHLQMRVSPGEPMPNGECPECGALCHEI